MSRSIKLSASMSKLNATFCAANDSVHDERETRAKIAARLASEFPKAPGKALELWNALLVHACDAYNVRYSMSKFGRIGIPPLTDEERANPTIAKARGRLYDLYINVLVGELKKAKITLAGSRERGSKVSAAETDMLARDAKLLARHLKAGEYTRKQLLSVVQKLVASA